MNRASDQQEIKINFARGIYEKELDTLGMIMTLANFSVIFQSALILAMIQGYEYLKDYLGSEYFKKIACLYSVLVFLSICCTVIFLFSRFRPKKENHKHIFTGDILIHNSLDSYAKSASLLAPYNILLEFLEATYSLAFIHYYGENLVLISFGFLLEAIVIIPFLVVIRQIKGLINYCYLVVLGSVMLILLIFAIIIPLSKICKLFIKKYKKAKLIIKVVQK